MGTEADGNEYWNNYFATSNPNMLFEVQHKKRTLLAALDKIDKKHHENKLRILDIAFGFGELSLQFHKSCYFHGVDINPVAVKRMQLIAKKRGIQGSFRVLDVSDGNLPYPDAFFDIVICSHVLEHVTNDEGLIESIHRVLKESGIAIMMIPINERITNRFHVRAYDVSEFMKMVKKKRFKIIYTKKNEKIQNIFWDPLSRVPARNTGAHKKERIYQKIFLKMLNMISIFLLRVFPLFDEKLPFVEHRNLILIGKKEASRRGTIP
ncbi:MAG: class I SAM-dependent methyltransferase [Candidatus Lokiarchaeota archaeon]|nr:class I SAM-dependent methyltransferase [Candidatus Lokiarchaeota archaeon]